jgi:hypothetical protein
MHMRSILSFDIHQSDEPRDIDLCAERLESAGRRASFFVPTNMLCLERFRGPLHGLATRGFELGTHSHDHSWTEMEALRKGSRRDLVFLERSADAFADFFGERPRMFRAPCWAHPGDAALDELSRLGYQVDSSVTPQRPGILSSFPGECRNMFSCRAPRFVRPELLEVPTSTLLLPLGWPTFCTLRRTASRLLVDALVREASFRASLVLVAQFHVADLVPAGPPLPRVTRCWSDLLPRKKKGIAARRWLRSTDRAQVASACATVMGRLAARGLTTFGAVRAQMIADRPGHA